VQARRVRQGQGVDFAAADHAQRCAVRVRDGVVQRMHYGLPRERCGSGACQYEIQASRQRTADRERGLATHQYRLAERQRLEPLQVIRQVPGHRARAADRAVAVERRDKNNFGIVRHATTGFRVGLRQVRARPRTRRLVCQRHGWGDVESPR